jgi:hypothetical protein
LTGGRNGVLHVVHRTYTGLGPPDAAVREFDALAPYVVEMLAMRGECAPDSPDFAAMALPLDGLRTAAFHFTRRRDFYHPLEEEHRERRAPA